MIPAPLVPKVLPGRRVTRETLARPALLARQAQQARKAQPDLPGSKAHPASMGHRAHKVRRGPPASRLSLIRST